MKKIWIGLLLLLTVSLLMGCSCSRQPYLGDDDDDDDQRQESTDKGDNDENEDPEDPENPTPDQPKDEPLEILLNSIGTEGVEYEVKYTGGSYYAKIIAQVPDYTSLFLAACGEADPNRALRNAIQNQNFTTVEYTGNVFAEMVDGEVVYDAEEAQEVLLDFVEAELIKAINAVTEQGGAGN